MSLLGGKPRLLLLIIGGLVLVMAVGVGNYLLNRSGGGSDGDSLRARARFDQPASLTLVPREVIRLSFNEDKTSEASARGIARSIESVFVGEGRVYVVDHPSWHVGARVRWFTEDGAFLGQTLTPSGSTLFSASPTGFAYVLAKSAQPNETVVLVDSAGSVEATYAVPLGANSGGLMFVDGNVYASVQTGFTDTKAMTIETKSVYLPVAAAGVQVPDAKAQEGVLEYWRRGLDGELYDNVVHADGFGPNDTITQTVERQADGAKLEIPKDAVALGVDPRGRVVVGLNPVQLGGSGRPLPGSPAAIEPFSEIVFIDFGGSSTSLNVLRTILPSFPVRHSCLDSRGGFWSLVAVPGGIAVERYTEKSR